MLRISIHMLIRMPCIQYMVTHALPERNGETEKKANGLLDYVQSHDFVQMLLLLNRSVFAFSMMAHCCCSTVCARGVINCSRPRSCCSISTPASYEDNLITLSGIVLGCTAMQVGTGLAWPASPCIVLGGDCQPQTSKFCTPPA